MALDELRYEACDKYEERGNDSRIRVGALEFPITNVSYDIAKNTSSQQFNRSMNPTIAVTGLEFSGSFEHTGSNKDVSTAVEDKNGFPKYNCELQIVVEEYERTVIFKNAVVTSRSKDIPSDDRTSETYDFEAERVAIN